MKGKISKIWINDLKDGRTYATLSINGERYNLWNSEYIGKLKEGDEVEYDFKQAGKYKNINTIKVLPDAINPETPRTEIITPALKKDREIVRMSCLKSALYLTQELVDLDTDQKADKAIELAKKFENYITDFSDLAT